MPFNNPDAPLRDIVDAIGMIETFVSGMNFEAFRGDLKTIAAVERKLQIVSEAAVRLGSEAERRCPGLPWRDIRGIGNHLRHAYERVDLEQIWSTICDDLPVLRANAIRALNESDELRR